MGRLYAVLFGAALTSCTAATESLGTAPASWGSTGTAGDPGAAVPLNQAITPRPAIAAAPAARVAEGPPLEWRTGFAFDAVEVGLFDPNQHYRIEDVRLVAPDGRSYPASDITREVVRERLAGWYGGVGVGAGGFVTSRRSAVGLGISIPIGERIRQPAWSGGGSTHARIPVPDVAEYRRTARSWWIDLSMVDRFGAAQFARIPAPVPPV